ncbi:hypothetical protein [Agromyces sp. NPDC049794]
MSDATTPQVTDAPSTDAAVPSPFTMVAGDPAAMVCEGDVCYIPGVGE